LRVESLRVKIDDEENNNVLETTPVKEIKEKIIGATDTSGELKLLVKREGIEEAQIILAREDNTICPQIRKK